MMKISIAVAAYNGEKYIEKQLLSLLNQTRAADEVIISDDCSGDNTAKIVENFIEQRNLQSWKLICGKENAGFKRNFYNAVSMTSGDIIFLCDQDDIWCENKLEVMEKAFKENKNIKALNSSFSFIDGKGIGFEVKRQKGRSNNNLIRRKIESGALEKIPFSAVCSYNISPGCTMAFTKDIKELYLKRTECIVEHDWEINFIAASLDGLYFINRPLIRYRIHTSNAIGLSEITGGADAKSKLRREVRLKKAEKMYNYTKSLERYSDLYDQSIMHEQKRFVSRRLNAIKSRNIFKVLGLYSQYSNYVDSVTLKGRIADIVCLVTK